MPSIPFLKLLDEFIVRLEKLGATVVELTPRKERGHRILVSTPGRSEQYRLYLWTVTPGGTNRPADEWRIQITNAQRFPLELGAKTIVGGWNPDFSVYVFWDARRHSRFSSNSPGFHVKQAALERAAHDGVSTHLTDAREGREVVVCVTPLYLLWYLQEGVALQDADSDAESLTGLLNATPEEERGFTDSASDEGEYLRRRNLVEVVRAYRSAKFRPDVLAAYRYKCAVCQTALKLVDAAHIVPVSHPKSRDVIINGLALCRLHHGAYDNALLGIRGDYSLCINPAQAKRLREANLASKLEEFEAALPRHIEAPSELEMRPDPSLLRLGLQARGWAESLVR